MKSPGKYVPMMKRMPPKGGKIPGAAGLVPAFGYVAGSSAFQRKASSPRPGMGVPSTFSSRTKTARPLALWPVTTVRTFIPCLFSSGLFMVTFLDRCKFVFICNFPFVWLKSFSVNASRRPPAMRRVSPVAHFESDEAKKTPPARYLPSDRSVRAASAIPEFAEVAPVGDGQAGPVEDPFCQPVVAHSL